MRHVLWYVRQLNQNAVYLIFCARDHGRSRTMFILINQTFDVLVRFQLFEQAQAFTF
jgi:hypothetical protein